MLILFSFSVYSQDANDPDNELSNYTPSWLGNTWKGEPGWVPHDVADIYVCDDGTVYTNVPWEEGRNNVIQIKDGNFVDGICPFAGDGGNNVPRMVGNTVTANSKYVYFACPSGESGEIGHGITRRDRTDLDANDLNIGLNHEVRGLCASSERVYAACDDDRIRIYDTALNNIGEFNLSNPYEMCLDHENKIWILQGTDTVLRYDKDGTKLSQEIHLPAGVLAKDVALMNDGRLIVTDAGEKDQIRIYKNITSDPELDQTFGETGGIDEGDNPGRIGTMRFLHPIGVGCDANGNIYVANGNPAETSLGSTLIQSYTQKGKLNWRVFAQAWIDCPDIDPATGTDLYTKNGHYTMDFSKSPGNEQTLQSITYNFEDFPGHPLKNSGHEGGTIFRELNGERIIYVNTMFGEYHIFRFEGEIAVPCGHISSGELWYDANGNGIRENSETTDPGLEECRGWWVDKEGTIWAAHIAGDEIYKFPLHKIDTNGILKYKKERMTKFSNPGDISELRRIRYYPSGDVMYLGGGTEHNPAQHWKPMGPNLVRYENWHDNKTKKWHKVLPWQSSSKDGHESYEPAGIDVAGNFVFVVWVGEVPEYNIPRGTVAAYDKMTGDFVGYMFTPESFASEHLGIMDICQAINAYKRDNGEYLIFIEEDGRSKVTMFRWCPKTNCTK